MFKSIKILKDEHRSIENLLNTLEYAVNKLEKEKIDTNLLKELINVLLEADMCYHGKEEDIFFVELEKYGAFNGPIGVMLYEHQYLRKLRKIMEENIDKLNEDENAKTNFISASLEYINILRNHILKEDNVLFRLAEDVLTQDIDEKMYNEFNEINIGHQCPHYLNTKAQELHTKI